MFWQTLWALVLGFSLSGVMQAFVSRREMRRLLGDSGLLSLVRATGFGAASSSCSYASAAMAKSMFAEGANFVTAMVFMFASTNLVIELGIVLAVLIGWQFTASELFGGLLMILLFVMVARVTLPAPLTETARRRLRADLGSRGQRTAGLQSNAPWRVRLRSGALWTAAAGFALADLRMLRKEIAGGFLIAGFLAVLVPTHLWQDLFLTGHGLGSAVENAALGPLIAMLSFVCSVGNVPLAAALWKGGISFGGVVSFIYADLITFPLLLIYRKYYGGRLTLRLLASFWLVMSAAGLATQYLFQALGAVPLTRPRQIAVHALGWNFTTGLDFLALVLLVGIALLARRGHTREPDGLYAVDIVCGMQVERAAAPAQLTFGGQQLYFCSDRCRDRFRSRPDHFGAVRSLPMPTASGPLPQDPVCGMDVDPSSAAAEVVHAKARFYFCSTQCRDRFLQHPDRFGGMRSLSPVTDQPALAVDPICGMSVDRNHPGVTLEGPLGTVYFCCQSCADEYAATTPTAR